MISKVNCIYFMIFCNILLGCTNELNYKPLSLKWSSDGNNAVVITGKLEKSGVVTSNYSIYLTDKYLNHKTRLSSQLFASLKPEASFSLDGKYLFYTVYDKAISSSVSLMRCELLKKKGDNTKEVFLKGCPPLLRLIGGYDSVFCIPYSVNKFTCRNVYKVKDGEISKLFDVDFDGVVEPSGVYDDPGSLSKGKKILFRSDRKTGRDVSSYEFEMSPHVERCIMRTTVFRKLDDQLEWQTLGGGIKVFPENNPSNNKRKIIFKNGLVLQGVEISKFRVGNEKVALIGKDNKLMVVDQKLNQYVLNNHKFTSDTQLLRFDDERNLVALYNSEKIYIVDLSNSSVISKDIPGFK